MNNFPVYVDSSHYIVIARLVCRWWKVNWLFWFINCTSCCYMHILQGLFGIIPSDSLLILLLTGVRHVVSTLVGTSCAFESHLHSFLVGKAFYHRNCTKTIINFNCLLIYTWCFNKLRRIHLGLPLNCSPRTPVGLRRVYWFYESEGCDSSHYALCGVKLLIEY